MKEAEISIKGITFYILKRWKSIVVAMLVVFVGLIVLQIIKGYAESSEEIEVGSSLSDSEKDYVESVYDYLTELRETNASREESLIMNLDSDDLFRTELTYMISVNDSENLEGIELAYRNYLNGFEFIGYISDRTDIDKTDISDIVGVSYENSRNESSSTVIRIVIVSGEKTISDRITDVVEDYINEKSRELSKCGYEHEVTEIGNSTYQGPNLRIQSYQLQYLQEIQARNKTILDTENSITAAQYEYYESLINSSNSKDELNDYANFPTKLFDLLSIKYIILGMIVSLLMMFGLYFLIYIFENRLDEDDDVEGLFGTYLIGTVTGKDFGKAIYKLRHLGRRTFDFDESIRLISTKIKMTVRNENASKIGIIGCGIEKYNAKAANGIITILKNDGINVLLIDEPIYDSSSAEMLTEVERVVLLEKAGVTFRTEIWKEMELIKKLGIKVEGLIISE